MKTLRLLFITIVLCSGSLFAAFTERYVSVAGGGAHDGTTEADAWTFAEMIAATPAAGVRVNIKAGSYSTGAVTFLAGTVAAPLVYRGYNSTIGDLDNQGRNTDGTLNVTNFPVITTTASLIPAVFACFQNLSFTGAVSSAIIGSSTLDDWAMVSCKVVNTQNNAGAAALIGDDRISLFNSDVQCTGAAHGVVVDVDVVANVFGCRFQGVDTDALLQVNNGAVRGSVFIGTGSNNGLVFALAGSVTVESNTFYNLATAVTLPNAVNTTTPTFINNICTDSSKWIDSLYAGTANVGIIECNNRTRDVTTLLTGVESIRLGAVTTDTGGPETDYVDAGAGNLRLISASPAVGVGMTPYLDIGAFQRQAAAAGGQRSYSF